MTAPYRDDLDALSARHAALSEELSSLRTRLREAESLQQQETRLAAEVTTLEAKLAGMKAKRALPLLESVRIASPCTASWDAMQGDDRVRFCGQCEKNVYNLSGLARDEAEKLVRERTSEICVRLYKRQDGTVITADCPVGVKRKRRRRLVAAAAVAVGSGLTAYKMVMYSMSPTMGEAAVMGGMPYEGPAEEMQPSAPTPTAPEPATTVPPAEQAEFVMGRLSMRPIEATPTKGTTKGKRPPARELMGKPVPSAQGAPALKPAANSKR